MQGMQGDVGPGVDDTVHGFGGDEVSGEAGEKFPLVLGVIR